MKRKGASRKRAIMSKSSSCQQILDIYCVAMDRCSTVNIYRNFYLQEFHQASSEHVLRMFGWFYLADTHIYEEIMERNQEDKLNQYQEEP